MARSDQVVTADKLLRKVLLAAAGDHLVRCITCSRVGDAKTFQVGHFLGRSRLNVRYDRLNVSLQCVECNFRHHGRPREFEEILRRKHGDGAIDDLISRGNQMFTGDMDEIIANLKKDLQCLKSKER